MLMVLPSFCCVFGKGRFVPGKHVRLFAIFSTTWTKIVTMRKNDCAYLSLLILILVTTGCSGTEKGLAKATGQVIYKGKPVEGANVTFLAPDGARQASGVTDEEGRFSLSTYSYKDGATIGSNTVVISKVKVDAPSEASASALNGPPPATGTETVVASYVSQMDPSKQRKGTAQSDNSSEHLIPAKYANPKTTPLKAEVTQGGPNQFVFELAD